MRYLTPCAIVFCMAAANAETETNATSSSTAVNSNLKIQQTTQSVARKLVTILGLKTVSGSEQTSISLKSVVIKALSEGKQMNEIRLATNQAVKEVVGRALPGVSSRSNTQTKTTPAPPPTPTRTTQGAVPTAETSDPAAITANPAEVSLDPETGNMVATVLPGESIFRLAQRVYGKENGRKYLEIYAANRDKIKNINVVVEGQILTMP